MTDNPFELVLDRLREKGWRKNGFGDWTGPNCIVGAHMTLNNETNKNFRSFRTFLVSIIHEHYSDRSEGRLETIPNFNDHPDTTFADVERVLEKAAVKWEEERVLRND